MDYVFDAREFDLNASNNPSSFLKPGEARHIEILGPESLEAIVDRLVDLGYRVDDIQAVLEIHFMRVAKRV